MAVRSAYHFNETCKKITSSTATDNEKMNTLYGVEIVGMSRAHIMYLTFKLFKESLS